MEEGPRLLPDLAGAARQHRSARVVVVRLWPELAGASALRSAMAADVRDLHRINRLKTERVAPKYGQPSHPQ